MVDKHDFIPFARPDVTDAEVEAVVSTIRSGWLTTGPSAATFEREFADYLGEGLHAVAVNSATAGMHLALEAIGIGPGDEVLVPTWTFTATAEVVVYLGATPVFVDVVVDSLNIDLADAAKKVTKRTKAIMPVDFAGLPVGGARVQKFADEFNLQVVQDAAHAFPVLDGAAYLGNNRNAATVFSFYATKTITTGEGGMLVTSDAGIAERARIMRLHGINRDIFNRYVSSKPSWEYSVVAPGFKYNMTDIAAAIGRVQLGRAENMRVGRMDIARKYDSAFSGLPVTLPAKGKTSAEHSYHLYVLRINENAPVSRNQFIEELSAAGIGTSVHFIPLHKHPYWKDTFSLDDDDFPVATSEFDRVVSLPIYSSMTEAEVDRVIATVRNVLISGSALAGE